jgi:hypothetical protein
MATTDTTATAHPSAAAAPAPAVTVIHQYQPAARARAALLSRLDAIAREAGRTGDVAKLAILDNEADTVRYRIAQLDQAELERQAWHERVSSLTR